MFSRVIRSSDFTSTWLIGKSILLWGSIKLYCWNLTYMCMPSYTSICISIAETNTQSVREFTFLAIIITWLYLNKYSSLCLLSYLAKSKSELGTLAFSGQAEVRTIPILHNQIQCLDIMPSTAPSYLKAREQECDMSNIDPFHRHILL